MWITSVARFGARAALFLVPIFPLIVVDFFFFPFITGKAFYFRLLVEIAFACWVILAFADHRYRPRFNALTVSVSLFTLVALISDLLGVNPLRSLWSNFERMEGWITIIHLWMFYIVITGMFGSGEGARRWWRWWLNTFLVVGAFVACYGFAQLFGWADIHQGSTRIDASLGNAIYMAVYMLMNVGFAAYLFFDVHKHRVVEKKHTKKGLSISPLQWFYLVGACIFAFLIFQTATRGTILGLVGGVILALLVYAIFGKHEPIRWRRMSVVAVGIIVLIGVVFWMNRDAQFVRDSEVLSRLASISWNETKTQARSYIWPMALTGWTQRPILGWGQENFNYVFNANYNPHMWSHEQWFDRAHNVYLDWLIAGGIVGLITYLVLYIVLMRAVWKSHLSIAEKSVLIGLIVGYAIHNVFVFDNLASYVGFFALLAYAGSALVKGEYTILGGKKEIRSEVVEYVVVPVVIILVLIYMYVFTVRAVLANTRLIQALQSCNSAAPRVEAFEKVFALRVYVVQQEAREHLTTCVGNVMRNQQLPLATRQAFHTMVIREIDRQIAAAPRDARSYLLPGQFWASVGDIARAQPLLETAYVLTPGKPMVKIALADVYLNTGETSRAIELLENAYTSDPRYPQARFSYAFGLIAIGKEADAREIFDNDPEIFETERLAQLYLSLNQPAKAVSIYRTLMSKNPADVQLQVRLAEVQFRGGMKDQAILTLQNIAKDHPEFKSSIDEAIKQIRAQK